MPTTNPVGQDASVKAPKASQISRYQRIMHEFMEFHLAGTFPLDHQFSDEHLSTVTPESILKWMNKKVCGDDTEADFLKGDITTVHCSYHVLDFYKKSISYFMPEKGMVYDPESRRGNPTRSKIINNFIKKVKEIGGEAEGEQKKRKRESSASIPLTLPPLQSVPLTLPSASSAITVPINSSTPAHSAVPVQNILRRMVAQNNQLIELFGTFSATMDQFNTNLRINNQQLLAEINALESIAPPNLSTADGQNAQKSNEKQEV